MDQKVTFLTTTFLYKMPSKMSSNLSQTHLLCSHLILVHKILILFHMTWYQNLMHNIVIQLRNSGYSGFEILHQHFSLHKVLAFIFDIPFQLKLPKMKIPQLYVALLYEALLQRKMDFEEYLWFFKRKKNCAQKGAKIILDMIKGTKRVLSSQELVNSTKLNLYIF